MHKIRVCVVGAGAAGLCAARHLSEGAESFEFKVYEQQAVVGGTWVYTERTGKDEYGFPLHSSMYKNLKTNLPMEVMSYPDFPYKKGENSFVGHAEVLDYLEDYAKHFGLFKHIKFRHRVQNIRLKDTQSAKDLWLVDVLDVQTEMHETLEFDDVMICVGSYSKPHIPDIPGLDRFKGQVLHSHDYRRPEAFAGQYVVILGAGSSGMDIAMELSSHANQVILSHNKDRKLTFRNVPKCLSESSGIASVLENRVHFQNGESIKADAILLCTGYDLTAPDLVDPSVDLTRTNRRISTLYKHTIHVPLPSLALLGVMFIVVPFPLFDRQVQYLLSVWKGETGLPTKTEMMEDIEKDFRKRLDLGWPVRHAHAMNGEFQWQLVEDLETAANLSPLPPHYKGIYEAAHQRRVLDPFLYKNDRIVLHDDHTFEIITGGE